MSKISDFRDVISLWPTVNSFGDDLGLSGDHAHAMKHRNSVPSKYWGRVIAAAVKRNISGVDYAKLAQISSRPARAEKINGHTANGKKRP